ncbi:MAG: ATP-binding protein [Pseudomonadota bacterium]
MSFRLKTILGIAVIELTVMAILIFVNQLNFGATASAQLYERVRTSGELFATMVADAVIATDLATLDAMIENTLANDGIVYLRVRNSAGVPLSQNGSSDALQERFVQDASFENALSDHRIDIASPIQIAGQDFGSVEIGVSTRHVEQEMSGALQVNMIVAVLGMCLVAIFGYLLGSILTGQLMSLRQGAKMIAAGDLGHQIAVRGRDELADTARCFNEMANTLAQDRAALDLKQAELIDKRDRTSLIVDSMIEIASGTDNIEVPDYERRDEIGDMARATLVFQNAMREIQEARAEQARLIHAFDQLEEQVAIFDENGRNIFANASFRQSNSAVLDKLPHTYSYADFLTEGIQQNLFPDAVGQEDEWLAVRLSDQAGTEVPSEIAFAPDRTLLVNRTTVAGIGMVVSISDVTELKTSQAQLIQASKLATLGEMATGMAHELNQPLGVIRMAANNCTKRIQKGHIDADYLTGKLQRISDQTARAAQIIDHMRIFGRKADGDAQTFDLVASLESACALTTKQLALAGIKMQCDFGAETFLVIGQQVMFEQVILNLIGNGRDAIVGDKEAADEGMLSLRICGYSGDRVTITIEDTGGGIPDHVIDRLFDPFFTTKAPGKGTGLGLSISYGIIREMGGTITVENTERGAMFRIELPRATGSLKTEAA